MILSQEINENSASILGQAIEKAFSEKKHEEIEKYFDDDENLVIALSDIDISDNEKMYWRLAAGEQPLLPKIMKKIFAQSISMKFLRFRKNLTPPRIVFRNQLLSGLNYVELFLKPSTPSLKIFDIFNFNEGVSYSEQRGRLLRRELAEEPGSKVKLSKKDSEFFKHFPEIKKIDGLYKEGKHAQALLAIKGLPVSIQEEKWFLGLWMGSANKISSSEILNAFKIFEDTYPDDPFYDICSIDAFYFSRQYSKAIEAINRLDRRVGGDSYLDFLRAKIYFEEKNYPLAKTHAQSAIKTENYAINPYNILIAISIIEKNYDDTVFWCSKGEEFGIIIDDFKNDKNFRSFFESKAYKDWMNVREISK